MRRPERHIVCPETVLDGVADSAGSKEQPGVLGTQVFLSFIYLK